MSEHTTCEIRNQLLAIMEGRDITVHAIARKMGRKDSAVRAWLYGQRDDAMLSTVEAVAQELGVRLSVVNNGEMS